MNKDQNEQSTTGIRAQLDKKPSQVAAMFDEVAGRYDLLNDVLSLGQVRLWRKAVVAAIKPQRGNDILDLAAGTGTSADALSQSGAYVIACDLSDGMIEEGRRRYPGLNFVQADATNLPFSDNQFDAVTISFGLRNVQDTQKALREMLRVTKPGGTLLICEFSTPENRYFRSVYDCYLERVLPFIAGRVAKDGPAYQYLTESIIDWPNQTQLGQIIAEAGWSGVQYRNLSGGIVALHRAHKKNDA